MWLAAIKVLAAIGGMWGSKENGLKELFSGS